MTSLSAFPSVSSNPIKHSGVTSHLGQECSLLKTNWRPENDTADCSHCSFASSRRPEIISCVGSRSHREFCTLWQSSARESEVSVDSATQYSFFPSFMCYHLHHKETCPTPLAASKGTQSWVHFLPPKSKQFFSFLSCVMMPARTCAAHPANYLG